MRHYNDWNYRKVKNRGMYGLHISRLTNLGVDLSCNGISKRCWGALEQWTEYIRAPRLYSGVGRVQHSSSAAPTIHVRRNKPCARSLCSWTESLYPHSTGKIRHKTPHHIWFAMCQFDQKAKSTNVVRNNDEWTTQACAVQVTQRLSHYLCISLYCLRRTSRKCDPHYKNTIVKRDTWCI